MVALMDALPAAQLVASKGIVGVAPKDVCWVDLRVTDLVGSWDIVKAVELAVVMAAKWVAWLVSSLDSGSDQN